ncbi:hypothetical protein [Streptomyces celluloflavus]|uniref:hypothetical protein n=1 Tax=Streptomyces celluloflavus TaxID=58344 RepID=UPI0036D10801
MFATPDPDTQLHAARSLLDALEDGATHALPTLSWTVTNGGGLVGEVLSDDPQGDFDRWAAHLQAEREVDPKGEGLTVLRAITDDGIPGRGRRVRVVIVARIYDRTTAVEPATA